MGDADERRREGEHDPERDRDPGPPPPRRRRWGRRGLLTLGVLVLLLVAGIWAAGRRADKGLGAELAAYRAAGEPATVDELNRWSALRSGEGENAVPLLRAAAAKLKTNSAAWKAATEALQSPPLAGEEVAALEALVKEGADALATLDEATARTRIDWDPQYRSPVMLTMGMPTDLNEQRGLVRLGAVAGGEGMTEGEIEGAVGEAEHKVSVGKCGKWR